MHFILSWLSVLSKLSPKLSSSNFFFVSLSTFILLSFRHHKFVLFSRQYPGWIMTVCLKRLLPAVVWRQVDIRTLQQSVDTTATILVKKMPKKEKKKTHWSLYPSSRIVTVECFSWEWEMPGNSADVKLWFRSVSKCTSGVLYMQAMATKGVGRPQDPLRGDELGFLSDRRCHLTLS